MVNQLKLIVTIPAFNEEEKIGKVIQSIPRHVIGCDTVKVLVINDGSLDDTSLVAKKAGADYIFTHRINTGVGQAFKDGISKAIELVFITLNHKS